MAFGTWRRRLIPPLISATLATVVTAAPALAGYQATADVNITAFDVCDGTPNSIPGKMLTAAVSAYRGLGYTTTGYSRAGFTKAQTLSRATGDWGFYVHSHGDYYWYSPDGRSYTGFREDSGDCSQQVVYSKEIALKRAGRQANLVFISTCHATDSNTTLPGAFAIARTKTLWPSSQGPEFYVGYTGIQWDSDEWLFEQRYWSAIVGGKGAGGAFDIAMSGWYGHASFDADWWGSYIWAGRAGPLTSGCPTCA